MDIYVSSTVILEKQIIIFGQDGHLIEVSVSIQRGYYFCLLCHGVKGIFKPVTGRAE
jgi:hypothetical protein